MDLLVTRAAESVIERAAAETAERRQRAVEPRHILLGLLEERRTAADLLLRDLTGNPAGLSKALDDSLPRRQDGRPETGPSDLPYTERAEQILEDAQAMATDDERQRVGTADLLLALAAAKGIARTILQQFGIEEEQVRSSRAVHRDAIAAEDRDEEVEVEDAPPGAVEEAAPDHVEEAPSEPFEKAEPEQSDIDREQARPRQIEEAPPEPVEEPEPEQPETKREEAPPGQIEKAPPEEQVAPDSVEAEAPKATEEATAGRGREPSSGPPVEAPPSPSRPPRVALSFLSLDPSEPRPLYRQIAEGIEEAAATGRIDSGARLPSIREAADAFSVSSGTVARAYRELEDAEIVQTRGTRGTFVAAPDPSTATPKRIRELADRLRGPVVAAYHMGLEPEALHRALDRAMAGILTPGDEEDGGGS